MAIKDDLSVLQAMTYIVGFSVAIVYFLEHARIIFNSHACKFLPVSAAESVFDSRIIVIYLCI